MAKTLQTEPIVQNGELYVHIRWVENVLGAYVAYSSETKTLSIDLIEPKFKLKMLEKLNESIITPVNVPAAQLTGDTRLLYSNNPETLSYETVKTEQVTLWHDIVETDKDLVKHRVYGWHINELGEDGQVGITVENLSSENSISVKQIKGISKVSERSWQIYDIGLPIAEAYMGGFLNAEPHDIPVSSSNSALIKSFELKENHLIGFLYEFTVEKSSGKGDLNYKIRTVFSTDNNDLTNIKGEPIPLDLDRRHPRGSWEQADLEATLPVYETSSKEVSYSISNGLTDHLMTKETSIDSDHALGNPGHFGAVYKVNIPLINSSDRAKTVRIRLGARGGQAAVAIKHKEGSFISPFLKDFTEAAKIMDVEIGSDESKEIELTIMHGGGSNLPVAINLSTLE